MTSAPAVFPRACPPLLLALTRSPELLNLWRFTELGADLVVFSGGKTLRGPQASGLIVGRKALMEAIRTHTDGKGNKDRVVFFDDSALEASEWRSDDLQAQPPSAKSAHPLALEPRLRPQRGVDRP